MTDTPVDPAVMLTAQPPKSIHILMGEIVNELPAIGKNSTAAAAMGGYKFRGIEDVMNALNPILSAKGVFVTPVRVEYLGEENHPTGSGKASYDTKIIVTYRWYGPGGDFIESAAIGEGGDGTDKGSQKAMTSAFKYMLFETLFISTEEGTASDIDHGSAPEAPALSEQEQRKVAWGDKPLPDGWKDFEEFDTAHQRYMVGIKTKSPEIQAAMKAFREAQGFPFPMSAPEMNRMLDEVVRLEAEAAEFAPADPAPDPAPAT